MKRKFLASLLALCMMLTAVPGAWAAEGEGGEAVEAEQTEGSPVATENAACIVDGQEYPTLQEAVDAADSDTVVLLKDVTEQITIKDGQKVEIDLNGKTISNETKPIILEHGDLTLTGNGVVTETQDNGFGAVMVYGSTNSADKNYSVLTVGSGVTLGGWSGIFLDNYKNQNVSYGVEVNFDGTIISPAKGTNTPGNAFYIQGNIKNKENYPVITIGENAEIAATGDESCAIYAAGYADWTINGGEFSADGVVEIKSGSMRINGGTFTSTNGSTSHEPNGSGTSSVGYALAVVNNKGYAGDLTVEVDGGLFNSPVNILDDDQDAENNTAKLSITGGTFSSDPSEFVTDDYRAVEENGQFVVKSFAEVAVAKIGGDYYETLEKAINAVQDEGKITLLHDTKENVTVPAGKTITLDLNGCTLNGGTESGKAALTNYGTVTIKDTGRDGTIQREDTAESGSYYTILNNGTMTIESGIVKNDSGVQAPGWAGSSLICNGGSQEATLTINGGEIAQDNFIAVKNDEFGTLVVNGGTITSKTQAIQNWKDATINGGELTGQVTTWTYKQTKSLTQIKGGQFDGEILASKYGNAAYAPVVAITAGYFTKDPSAYVAAGFAVLKSDKAGYDYQVRKPGVYTVTYATAHGEAPAAQTVTETLAGAAVITLPAAPSVEGYTFLGWALDGETYAAGEKYTVTKDVTFTAKWAENVDTPVVDEEVVILPSAPVVPQPDTAGKPQAEAEAMKDMAEALQQPGAVEVEGLTDAAKDEIRDAAAAADKNEAFQEIVKEAQEKDPTAEITTTIVLEPYMDIQVKDAQVDGDKIAVELELTPMVKAKATIDPQHMTEANTVVLYTQEMNVTETVTITLPLPDVFAGNTEDLYVKHETGKKTYYYDTTVVNGKVIFENPHGFSTFTLVTDDRYAEVQLGDLLCEFVPSDVGMSLDMEDAYDAPRGEYFVGWKFDGISGVHDTLTDELLTKLAEKYNEDGKAVQAKPVFDEKSTGGSVDRGYAIRLEKTENGKVTAPSSATAGSTVTIKVKPDAGYQLDELVVTDKDGDELKLTDKGNGKFTFKMPKSKVTVEATFVEIDREPEAQELPFVDVADTAYYADAVRWAVAEGITGGTSAATFSPNAACTRAQAVTFLWRAAGSPVVNYAMGFTDVPADAYYAEAVRWAVSQGITTGATETTFAPDAPCTRAQIVTFIYRNVKAQGGGFTGSWMFPCPFTDVSADAYYFESVQWCVMKGITEGATETTFAPDATCTRAQIVTFLYRGAEK